MTSEAPRPGMVWRQDDPDGETVFHRMGAAFERALAARSEQLWESSCVFAGEPARLRIVGRGLAQQLTPALAHLLAPGPDAAAPRLRIDLWDEGETGVSRPAGSAEWDEDEQPLFIGSRDDRFVGCQRSQVLTWSDRAAGRIVGCATGRRLSVEERGKPLYGPLLLWHSDRGVEVIHAALVAREGQGVLLVGRGDAGKTTAALACLEAGFDYAGDDYIGLRRAGDGSFAGHSLYNSAWLAADQWARFPNLSPYVIYAEAARRRKSLVLLHPVYPQRMVPVAPVRVVLLLELAEGGATRSRPASKGQALLAVAPSSLIQLPVSRARTLTKLADLVERVPCHWLEMGRDLGAVPRCVEEALAEAGR